MAWMISINGFIVDVRTMPREVQAEARQRGLIPDVPAPRMNTGGETRGGGWESREGRGAADGNIVTGPQSDASSMGLAKQQACPEEKIMNDVDSEWQRKGATLSDKTARKEFGLTQDEIVEAIRAGELQYRRNSIHGNPFLRLVRREVEALVKKQHGSNYLKDRQVKTELARINRELKKLKTEVAILEERKSKLLPDPGR